MIDRYTRPQTEHRLSTVTLPAKSSLQVPPGPPSPTHSMRTHPSATNPLGIDPTTHKVGSTQYIDPAALASPQYQSQRQQAGKSAAHRLSTEAFADDSTSNGPPGREAGGDPPPGDLRPGLPLGELAAALRRTPIPSGPPRFRGSARTSGYATTRPHREGTKKPPSRWGRAVEIRAA